MSEKLRVLVVDDSAYNRQIIAEFLGGTPGFEIVGKADDGEQALKLVAILKPDLITLDIEMPRMDGFTFLRLLMSQMPTPVIVISSHSRKQEVFQALELGALDFVAKPMHYLQPDLRELKEEVVRKAEAVRALQLVPFSRRVARPPPPLLDLGTKSSKGSRPPERLVVIGASTGGPPALQSILKAMPAETRAAFLIAQHMPEKFTHAFAERLHRVSPVVVREAEHGEQVLAGTAYVAPGGAHMEVVSAREGLVIRLAKGEVTDRYIPSVDRLFQSAARLPPISTLGVVLTGMGADGAQGIPPLKTAGAKTLAESQESAIVFGMPKEAISTRCIDDVLPLDGIIERIHAFAQGG